MSAVVEPELKDYEKISCPTSKPAAKAAPDGMTVSLSLSWDQVKPNQYDQSR